MKNSFLTMLRARQKTAEGGFTLIELLVVMLIIGILLAIAIPTFLSVINTSHNSAAQSDLGNAIIEVNANYTQNLGGFGQNYTTFASEMSSGETNIIYTSANTVTAINTVAVSAIECDNSNPATLCQGAELATPAPSSGECFYVLVVKDKAVSTGLFLGHSVPDTGTFYATLGSSSSPHATCKLDTAGSSQSVMPSGGDTINGWKTSF